VSPTVQVNPPAAATGSAAPAQRGADCISENQEKRLYAIMKAKGVKIDHLKAWIKKFKKIDHLAQIKKGADYDRICKAIEEQPEFFEKDFNSAAPSPAAAAAPADANNDAWIDELRAAGLKAGLKTDDAIAKELADVFQVPDALQTSTDQRVEILNHLNGLAAIG
jgi:hypothetical protein